MNSVALLLRAITAALEIWSTNARYLLTKKIEADILDDEFEIARLRHLGDQQSTVRADQLRERILRAQGIATGVPNLPAAGPAPGEGNGSPNA